MPPVDAVVTTLTEWLADAERRLATAGVLSARADAERLAAHAMGVTWSDLWTRLREPMPSADADALVVRRERGEPMGYIVGSVAFHGLEIACGPGVLVPRPETETLVDVALELISDVHAPVVADIGTGTGAVAVAVARARRDAQVWATDASDAALAYAARNIETTGTAVRIARGDLCTALPETLHARVDLLASNPPYVPDGTDLPADVRAEPPEALFAGPQGAEVLLRLVREASAWLGPRGSLALEVGTPDQAELLARELGDFGAAGVREDRTHRPRVVWARR